MTHRRRLVLAAAALVVVSLVATLGAAPVARPSSAAPAIGVEVEIAPSTRGDGTYTCTASLRDLATGQVLSEPRVVFRSGESAETRSGLSLDGEQAHVELAIAANGADRTATVRVDFTRGDARTTIQSVRVHL